MSGTASGAETVGSASDSSGSAACSVTTSVSVVVIGMPPVIPSEPVTTCVAVIESVASALLSTMPDNAAVTETSRASVNATVPVSGVVSVSVSVLETVSVADAVWLCEFAGQLASNGARRDDQITGQR